jgi:hypothetical protein
MKSILIKALEKFALALPKNHVWSKQLRKTWEKAIREAKESIPIKYIYKQWDKLDGPHNQTEQNTLKRLVDGWLKDQKEGEGK